MKEAAARKEAERAESQSQLDLEKAALHAKAASLARDTVVVSRDTIRNNLYFAQMNLAHQALLDNDIPQVDKFLNEHLPGEGETDLRGFEWYYLRHAGRKAKHRFSWKGQCVAVSPRGDFIATVSHPGSGQSDIHILDTKNWLFQFKLPLDKAAAGGWVFLAFSRDGKRLAVGHGNSGVALWSIDDRKQLWSRQPYENKSCLVREIVFSPDGSRIAIANGGSTGSDTEVLLLDAATGDELRRFPTKLGMIGSLAYPSADKLIAGAAFEQLFCWNPETGDSVWDTSTDYNTHATAGLDFYNSVFSLAVAPDQSQLAAGLMDGSVRLFDINTGQQLARRDDHSNSVNQVAFSPDGTLLASASQDASCRIWNSTTLAPIASVPSNHGGLYDVAFVQDGQHLLTGGAFTVWSLKEVLRDSVDADYAWGAQSLAVSADGRLFANYPHNGNVRIHNIDDPQAPIEFKPVTGASEMLFLGQENAPLLAGFSGQMIWTWDITSQQEAWRIDFPDVNRAGQCFCVSDDGQRVATSHHNGGGTDPAIRIWAIPEGKMLHEFTDVKTTAFGVAFSPDRSLLFSVHAGSPTMIYKWNIADGTREAFGEETGSGPNRKATFSADSKLLAASMGTFIHILDPMTGEELVKCQGHAADVMSMCFLDEGRTLASGAIDNTVRLWDVATGQLKMTFRDHRAMINSVVATPDGETLISASRDRTIRFRRARRENPLPSEIRLMKMSPDGKLVATAGFDDRVLRVWDRVARTLVFETAPMQDRPQSICFSPDSSRVAIATREDGATIYDTGTGDQVQQLELGTSGADDLAFSPDGRQLVVAQYRQLTRWDVATGEQVAASAVDNSLHIGDVAVSPDANQIVTGSFEGTLRVWNFETLEASEEFQVASSQFCLLKFIDATTVLCVNWDGTVNTINASTGEKIAGGTDGLLDLYDGDCSADGNLVYVVCTNGDIIELQRTEEMGYRETHRWPDVYALNSVAVTPDGSELFTAVGDGRVSVWDAKSHRGIDRLAVAKDHAHFTLDYRREEFSVAEIKEPSYFRERAFPNYEDPDIFEATRHARGMDVAISDDGELIAAAVGNEVRVWNRRSGQRLYTFQQDKLRVCAVAFRPDSKLLASAGWDRIVRLWDLETGSLFDEIVPTNVRNEISDLAFTNDGNTLAVACTGDPNRVELWDVNERRLKGSIATLSSYWMPRIEISPDGRYIAAYSHNNQRWQFGLWSLPDLELVYKGNWGGTGFCEFHPHEPSIVTGGAGVGSRRISLTDWATQPEGDWARNALSTAVSPDGRLFAAGYSQDVKIHRVDDLKTIAMRPQKHLLRVFGMQFTPDSEALVTIGFEGYVKVWDTTTGELIRRLE